MVLSAGWAAAVCQLRGAGRPTALLAFPAGPPVGSPAVRVASEPAAALSSPAIDAASAHVGEGYEDVAQERYAEAVTEFRAALAIDPHLFRVRYQLAVCYFALSRRREARKEFAQLQKEAGANREVSYYLGRIDLVERDFDSAIRRLLSVAANPPFPDTSYYLGSAYLGKAELGPAEKWLSKAQDLDKRDYRIADHLARVYQHEGRLQDAEKEYAHSAELREDYNQSAEQAVNCGRKLDTVALEQARLTCQKLYSPDDADKLTTLGMLYGQHGDYGQAIEPLARAAQLDPDSFETQHNLGLTYFRLKRYPEARAPLLRAVELRPEFFGSNALLGATLYALGEDQMAYSALDRAHQLNPADAGTSDLLFQTATLLARNEYEKGQYAGSLRYLRKTAELRPADASVHRRLAEIYGLLKQRSEADFETREAERLSHP